MRTRANKSDDAKISLIIGGYLRVDYESYRGMSKYVKESQAVASEVLAEEDYREAM